MTSWEELQKRAAVELQAAQKTQHEQDALARQQAQLFTQVLSRYTEDLNTYIQQFCNAFKAAHRWPQSSWFAKKGELVLELELGHELYIYPNATWLLRRAVEDFGWVKVVEYEHVYKNVKLDSYSHLALGNTVESATSYLTRTVELAQMAMARYAVSTGVHISE